MRLCFVAYCALTLLGPQSRFGDKLLTIRVFCPHLWECAVLKGLTRRTYARTLHHPHPLFGACGAKVADDDRTLLPALECLASIVIAVGGALEVSRNASRGRRAAASLGGGVYYLSCVAVVV